MQGNKAGEEGGRRKITGADLKNSLDPKNGTNLSELIRQQL